MHMSIVVIFWKVDFSSSSFSTVNMCYFASGVESQDKSSIKPNHKKTKDYEYLFSHQIEKVLQV